MLAMAKTYPPTWKRRLQALRKKHGLTQEQAAQRAGVALRTWIAWENRQRIPSNITARLLAHAFPDDVSV